MARVFGLIICALLLFSSVAHAQDTCMEYRVPDRNDVGAGTSQTITGTGWNVDRKGAYVGTSRVDVNACNEITYTVEDWSSTKGCKVSMVSIKRDSSCSGPAENRQPASYMTCSTLGFSLETRSTLNEPFTEELNVGYFRVGEDGQEDDDAFYSAAMGLVGQRMCVSGKRHVVGVTNDTQVNADYANCYTINGVQRCMVSANYSLTPTCEVCQEGDPKPSDQPPRPTEGDGDPGTGGGDPGTGGGDPGTGGGDPGTGGGDPGTGGGDPGTGGGDPGTGGGDPGTGGGDPGTGGQVGGGDNGSGDNGTGDSGGDGEGNGEGDDTECDPKKQDCDGQGNSFGGNCLAGFQCSGDAIQCAIARELHVQGCRFTKESDESRLYEQEKGKSGNQTGSLEGNQTHDISSAISKADALGGGQGLSDLTVTVMGKQITIPFSSLNKYLLMMGNILVAVALMVALKIIVI